MESSPKGIISIKEIEGGSMSHIYTEYELPIYLKNGMIKRNLYL